MSGVKRVSGLRRLGSFNPVDALLVFVPIAILLEVLQAPPMIVFVGSAAAIVPLAGLLGRATEQLAHRAGPGVGGLLNATFGNAAELIIAIIGLSRGLGDVVKASITGSIIGNCLLVLGLALLAGGAKYSVQRFNRTAVSLGATLMALAAIGMLVPTLFWYAAHLPPAPEEADGRPPTAAGRATGSAEEVPGLRPNDGNPSEAVDPPAVPDDSGATRTGPSMTMSPGAHGAGSQILTEESGMAALRRAASGRSPARLKSAERGLSREIAVVLGVVYVLSLVFSLRTHKHLYAGDEASLEEAGREAEQGSHAASEKHGRQAGAAGSVAGSITSLVVSSALIALLSEFLIGSLEPTAHSLGLTNLFVGVIVVAIVGNAAEHSSAVFAAMKNRMDLTMHIAVGSSLQIALFVTPLLVGLSYFIGPEPIDLHFTLFEVAAVALGVGALTLVSHDGETNWMEGVLLLAVYAILGIAFYFLPG